MGRPNAPIRLLVAMMILKEGFGKTRVSAAVLVTGGVFIMNLGA